MLKQFRTLAELNEAFADPQAAVDHFTAIRWKNGQFCPHCGHDKVYSLKRKNIYRCAQCKTNFSITVGTIFENSKLPLRVWFGAIWLITNHKKGIASTTLAVDLGITQKSAWFLLHRLRHAARTQSFNARPLGGNGGGKVVEIDETYVGGKAKNRHGHRSGTGGGAGDKVPVIGAVERNGEVVARVLDKATKRELLAFVNDVVSRKARLVSTDAHPGYQPLDGYPQHKIVNHQKGEWRNGDAHTNGIESVWALLKRQIIGIHHYVSRKHLAKYVDEMTWRLNRRALTAEERVNTLLSMIEGRLTYNALIGKA
jgi:transposase-like protein